MKSELNIAVVLPSMKLFGGVKRFVELGNRFIARGHRFTVFTPDGEGPDWCNFTGGTARLSTLPGFACDVLFFTEPAYVDAVRGSKAVKKVFYHVKRSTRLDRVLACPDVEVFVNSSDMHRYDRTKYGIQPFKAFGGVDAELFGAKPRRNSADSTVRILTYGRLNRRKKGAHIVVKACERVYRRHRNLELILFDTPLNDSARRRVESFTCEVPFRFVVDLPVERMPELYREADMFVSAERDAGWANTSAEAMAAHTPVIATKSGTGDFLFNGETGLRVVRHPFFVARAIRRLIDDRPLRERLAESGFQRIREFDWDSLASKILTHLRDRSSCSSESRPGNKRLF